MYIILVGLLSNCVYILENTVENKTNISCIISYLSNNIVIFYYYNFSYKLNIQLNTKIISIY